MTPNIGGIRQSCQARISGIANSTLFYGDPVWTLILKKKSYREKVEAAYRLKSQKPRRIVTIFYELAMGHDMQT